jgi:type IV pilus assembly protein PilM
MDFLSKGLSSLKKIISSDGSQSVLGLDIGFSSIKVVQMRKQKERAVLETYGEIALGPYAGVEVGQSVKLLNDKVVEALKDILKEANVKAKKTVISIPLKSSFITVIKIPLIKNKDISEIIKLEARRYIPISISEVLMDWWIFPEDKDDGDENEDKKKFIQILLVAIHKDVIDKYKDIISRAGLFTDALELESFSLIRSSISRETSPVAIVDFGALTTKVVIVDFGIIKEVHSISKGSQDLSIALSSSLNINFRRAEEIKREIGLSNLPENKEIVGIMELILDYIFSEINSVIRDYQKRYSQTVNKTIITGGGALLEGLVNFAVKQLSMEVNLADPFLKTEYPAFLEGALKKAGPSFSIAIGLALKELQ